MKCGMYLLFGPSVATAMQNGLFSILLEAGHHTCRLRSCDAEREFIILCAKEAATGLRPDGLSLHLSNSADARRSSAVSYYHFTNRAIPTHETPPTNEGIPQCS